MIDKKVEDDYYSNMNAETKSLNSQLPEQKLKVRPKRKVVVKKANTLIEQGIQDKKTVKEPLVVKKVQTPKRTIQKITVVKKEDMPQPAKKEWNNHSQTPVFFGENKVANSKFKIQKTFSKSEKQDQANSNGVF